jgi:hypothetical protein
MDFNLIVLPATGWHERRFEVAAEQGDRTVLGKKSPNASSRPFLSLKLGA